MRTRSSPRSVTTRAAAGFWISLKIPGPQVDCLGLFPMSSAPEYALDDGLRRLGNEPLDLRSTECLQSCWRPCAEHARRGNIDMWVASALFRPSALLCAAATGEAVVLARPLSVVAAVGQRP